MRHGVACVISVYYHMYSLFYWLVNGLANSPLRKYVLSPSAIHTHTQNESIE